jgi:hypothetical protein
MEITLNLAYVDFIMIFYLWYGSPRQFLEGKMHNALDILIL